MDSTRFEKGIGQINIHLRPLAEQQRTGQPGTRQREVMPQQIIAVIANAIQKTIEAPTFFARHGYAGRRLGPQLTTPPIDSGMLREVELAGFCGSGIANSMAVTRR